MNDQIVDFDEIEDITSKLEKIIRNYLNHSILNNNLILSESEINPITLINKKFKLKVRLISIELHHSINEITDIFNNYTNNDIIFITIPVVKKKKNEIHNIMYIILDFIALNLLNKLDLTNQSINELILKEYNEKNNKSKQSYF